MLRGVCSWIRTSKLRAFLHAPQNARDTSCSPSVDVYQPLARPSQTWFNATMKTSRQSLLPEIHKRKVDMHVGKHEQTIVGRLGLSLPRHMSE